MPLQEQPSDVLIAPEGRPADNWINLVRGATHDLEESLSDPDRLGQVIAQLTQFASDIDARMITGASPLGHQLAGVIAGRAIKPLALWAQNGAYGTVLIIEGVLVSGAQMARTARRAYDAGADRVVGAAVLADPNGLATCRTEMGDTVRVLSEIVLA